jgi:hypothetical protein
VQQKVVGAAGVAAPCGVPPKAPHEGSVNVRKFKLRLRVAAGIEVHAPNVTCRIWVLPLQPVPVKRLNCPLQDPVPTVAHVHVEQLRPSAKPP